MKMCFKCQVAKPLTEFYRHAAMADGHLGKCKECAKRDVREHRAANESVREYDRERSKLPHRAALRTRVTKAWRQRHPERARAQVTAARGNLKRPDACEACGRHKRLEKHHPDYFQPLLVNWLCKPCHAIADKVRRSLESSL